MAATSTSSPNRIGVGFAPLADLARALEERSTTSRGLLESCFASIEDAAGEGSRTFRVVNTASAIEAAEKLDGLRKAGRASSPFAGIPVSVKDLFDVEGEQTLAGSTVLRDTPVADRDAPCIARLRAAGFVPVGRTNMTEFAFSGVGLNPHYGTPRNPFDRERGRIPGGSSSGAAVSVCDGMAAVGLGTDTGGSCRIPAAMCGTVGFKPTARRIPRQGVVPLSFSLDSVGSLANTATCCAVIDSVMAGDALLTELDDRPAASMRLAVLRNYVFEDTEDEVANAFERALTRLSAAGASLFDLTIGELNDLPAINARGGLASAEAFAGHRARLATDAADYDPRVRVRIEAGSRQSTADYIGTLRHRRRLIDAAARKTAGFDAVIWPTVPMVAPTVEALADDGEYVRINVLALRNPSIVNFLDRCAVSIPIHRAGEAPVGMNLMGEAMRDRDLLAVAGSIESLLSGFA